MRSLRRHTLRPLGLLLIAALALGPIGCGGEVAFTCAATPQLAQGVGIVVGVLGVIEGLQKIDGARIENDTRRERLEEARRVNARYASEAASPAFWSAPAPAPPAPTLRPGTLPGYAPRPVSTPVLPRLPRAASASSRLPS